MAELVTLDAVPATSVHQSPTTGHVWRGHTPGYLVLMTQDKQLALVTGASSGIGLELARQFAKHGFDLVIAAEDHAIETVAPDLRIAGPNTVQVEAVRVDLATPEDVQRLSTNLEAARSRRRR
jgi:hypothetical protein